MNFEFFFNEKSALNRALKLCELEVVKTFKKFFFLPFECNRQKVNISFSFRIVKFFVEKKNSFR